MSTYPEENFDTKIEVREKLRVFIRGKNLSQAKLARSIGATRQNVSDWSDSGAMPAWAVLNLFRAYHDAPAFFLTKSPLVAEPSESKALSSAKKELVERVNQLATTPGRDKLVDALLKVIEADEACRQDLEGER